MVAGLIVLIAAVLGSVGIVGAFAWLWHRLRVIETRDALPASARIVDAVDALSAELTQSREEVHRLGERVDFLERLLENPLRDGADRSDR